ncbi:hypothetical protein [Streptomyces sp.]|uniref:hypothetical protein n=1 Tax=Streptomyces sp. TaxID=1931 RepID=UPI002D78873B|nr:hypothetical protein [Streptomyces sp.]HET6353460.1 hypothetical protein [Streptomyces sp.]
MTDFAALRRYLEEHRAELVSAADAPAFDRQLDNLRSFWAEEDDHDVLLDETWRVLDRFPAARLALDDAGFRHGPQQPATTRTAPPAESSSDLGDDGSEPTVGDTGGSGRTGRRAWLDRERITGVLAVCIVLTALVILIVSVFRVGDGERAAAKEALAFINGILGVVLGYYFGRMPGEARAEAAEGQARQARAELDGTLGEMRGILDSAPGAARGGPAGLSPEQLARMDAVLRRRR